MPEPSNDTLVAADISGITPSPPGERFQTIGTTEEDVDHHLGDINNEMRNLRETRFRVFRDTSEQTLTTATTTVIQFNNASYDPLTLFDLTTNFHFTVPITGYYLLIASLGYVSLLDTNAADCHFYVEGSERSNMRVFTGKDGSLRVKNMDILFLKKNEKVTVRGRHDKGVDATIEPEEEYSYFAAHLLSF